MRWFVEVSSLSPGGSSQRLTVEAATWQGALAQGRSSARDTAPLANFTIEVLPDGYRATNALTRTRYVVSKAPDDAPLVTEGVNVAPRPASVPPPSSDAARSPAATAASALGRRKTPAGGAAAAPRPSTPEPPRVAAAPIAAPVDRGKIFFRKSEDPGPRAPITYRELAIAMPEGTTGPVALAVARANLDDVRAELDKANAPAGRLVQLAVFDHEWTGRPQRAPLVALTWKDWRGNDPDVKYAGSTTAPAPDSAPALSARIPTPARAVIDAKGVASEINSAVEAARPAKPTTAPIVVSPAVEAIVSPSTALKAAPPAAVAAPAPAPVVAPAPAPAPVVAPAPAPAPAPVVAPAPAPAPVVAPVAVPATPTVVTAPSAPKLPVEAPPVSEPMPRSTRPDDLTSELFESMHDLHFMRDALDGADFVTELLREKIPTVVTLVHFYDINAKEFVVVKARAPNPSVVNVRTREGSGLVGASLKTGKPILVRDAAGDDRWSRERYQQAGHPTPKQILVVPMRFHGRFLGALELADHNDGEPFGDAEVHALAYVADQFAEFVDDRGVQISRGSDSTGSFKVIESVRPPPRR